jgi:hypothetical protein
LFTFFSKPYGKSNFAKKKQFINIIKSFFGIERVNKLSSKLKSPSISSTVIMDNDENVNMEFSFEDVLDMTEVEKIFGDLNKMFKNNMPRSTIKKTFNDNRNEIPVPLYIETKKTMYVMFLNIKSSHAQQPSVAQVENAIKKDDRIGLFYVRESKKIRRKDPNSSFNQVEQLNGATPLRKMSTSSRKTSKDSQEVPTTSKKTERRPLSRISSMDMNMELTPHPEVSDNNESRGTENPELSVPENDHIDDAPSSKDSQEKTERRPLSRISSMDIDMELIPHPENDHIDKPSTSTQNPALSVSEFDHLDNASMSRSTNYAPSTTMPLNNLVFGSSIKNGCESWIDSSIFRRSVSDHMLESMYEESKTGRQLYGNSVDLIVKCLKNSISDLITNYMSTEMTILMSNNYNINVTSSIPKLDGSLNVSNWHRFWHFITVLFYVDSKQNLIMYILDSNNSKNISTLNSYKEVSEVIRWMFLHNGIRLSNDTQMKVLTTPQQKSASNDCGIHSAINCVLSSKFLTIINCETNRFDENEFQLFLDDDINQLPHKEAHIIREEFHYWAKGLNSLYNGFVSGKRTLDMKSPKNDNVTEKMLRQILEIVSTKKRKIDYGNEKNIEDCNIDEQEIPDDSIGYEHSIQCLSNKLILNQEKEFLDKLENWRNKFMLNGEHINGKKSMALLGSQKPSQQKYSPTSRNRAEWQKRTKDGKYVCVICKTASPLNEEQIENHFLTQHNPVICVIASEEIDSIYLFKNDHYLRKYLRSQKATVTEEVLGHCFNVNVFYLSEQPNLIFEYLI